uniref:Uncharacterized protein n=1 Tax=Photinus pyralis TaxID=7054 RepID=A0A1Y1L6L4_PHOPY
MNVNCNKRTGVGTLYRSSGGRSVSGISDGTVRWITLGLTPTFSGHYSSSTTVRTEENGLVATLKSPMPSLTTPPANWSLTGLCRMTGCRRPRSGINRGGRR